MDQFQEFSLPEEKRQKMQEQIDEIIPFIIALIRNQISGYLIASSVDFFRLGGRKKTEVFRAAMQKVGFGVFVNDEPDKTTLRSKYTKKPDSKILGKFMLSIPKKERKTFQKKVRSALDEIMELIPETERTNS